MAVRCIECGSVDVDEDIVEDEILGDLKEYECFACGETFDEVDLENFTQGFDDCLKKFCATLDRTIRIA